MPLYQQDIAICQEVGDSKGENTILNNISQYDIQDNYVAGLNRLKQSLEMIKETEDKAKGTVISWNIGLLYKDQGNLRKAEKYMCHTVEIEEAIGLPTFEELRKTYGRATSRNQGAVGRAGHPSVPKGQSITAP